MEDSHFHSANIFSGRQLRQVVARRDHRRLLRDDGGTWLQQKPDDGDKDARNVDLFV